MDQLQRQEKGELNHRIHYGKKKLPWYKLLARDIRLNHTLYLYLLPAVLVIFLFHYIPIYGIQIAFRDFRPARGILGSEWVGLKHFLRFFKSYQFGSLIMNTLSLSAMSIILNFPFPIIMALLITQIKSKRVQRIAQTVTYMPHFISTVVMVGIIIMFLSPNSGLYGNLIKLMGGIPENLMANPRLFRPIYVITDMWQHSGWDSIIYIAALSSVDTQLYDAAMVDGASRFKRIIHIDIPCILPTVVILLILRVGGVMSVGFEKAFLMQNTLNITTSEIISTYVYKIGLQKLQYSYSAAIDIFNIVINFILLMSVNAISKRISDTGLW